jgi:predicted  nucleic acid-binding Zn-ribbon protein
MEKIEDLSAELQLLKGQKQEKDTKLKNQIRKNEELLGELQDLSEAVNALKNDKEFTINSQMLEEREQVIEDYQHFISNKQKRAIDRIFSTILKSVESIRDFSGVYQILRSPAGTNAPPV